MATVENGDVRIHYEWSGSGDGTVLVFSNSLCSDLHMWDKVVPSMENRYRILRYDMRGHGKSNSPPGLYTAAQLGSDLLFLLDHLALGRVHLCGLSLGGLVAMWIGIHAPQRVDRMILANTAASFGPPEGWDQRIAMVQSSGMEPMALGALERWFTPAYREQHPEEMETVRRMVSATNAVGYAGCCGALRDADVRREIAAIEAPCLVVVGAHDPATPPSEGRALHSALRNSSLVELEASHLSAWERPGEFASAVLGFLGTKERSDG
jgi:3-oxoadipate enol-lactonase